MVTKDEVILALRDVYDPEIPINVYDLGLIYEITIKESGFVHILMSLTSPTCPTAEYIQEMINDAVMGVEGVSSVDVELTFEPLWSPDRVSIEAKEELGLETGNIPNGDSLAVGGTFGDNNVTNSSNDFNESSLNICFNCSVSDKDFPILSCVYKGEEIKVCSKCLLKFN